MKATMMVPPIIAEERQQRTRRRQHAFSAILPFLCAGLAALAWISGRMGNVGCLIYVVLANFVLGFVVLSQLVFSRPFVSWSKAARFACFLVIVWFWAGGLARIGLSGFCKRLDAKVSVEQLRSWAEPLASSASPDRATQIDKDHVPDFVVEMMGDKPTVLADREGVLIINGGRAAILVRVYLSEHTPASREGRKVMWRPGVFVEFAGS